MGHSVISLSSTTIKRNLHATLNTDETIQCTKKLPASSSWGKIKCKIKRGQALETICLLLILFQNKMLLAVEIVVPRQVHYFTRNLIYLSLHCRNKLHCSPLPSRMPQELMQEIVWEYHLEISMDFSWNSSRCF